MAPLILPQRGLLLPKQAVPQTGTTWANSSGSSSVTVTLGQVPSGPLIAVGSADNSKGMYQPGSSQAMETTGYYWKEIGDSAPITGYGAASIWYGRRLPGAASASHLLNGQAGWYEGILMEVLGMVGETLWGFNLWNTGTTLTCAGPTVAQIGVQRDLGEPGLFLISAARFRSGGAGGVSATVTPNLPLLASVQANLCGLYIWKYPPRTRYTLTWTFARSTACSTWTGIVR